MNNQSTNLKDINNYVDILERENKEFKTQIEVLRKENQALEVRNNNLYSASMFGYFVFGLLGITMVLVAKYGRK